MIIKLLLVLLSTAANADKLVITPPRLSNETHLPGCANDLKTLQQLCAYSGSFTDETYAVKFKFSEIKGTNKGNDIAIVSVTRAGMTTDLDKYRKFDMAVSQIPGDFDVISGCKRQWATSGTELRINGKQWKPYYPPVAQDECPLMPSTQYYINIKAASAGCQATDGTYPHNGCRVTVATTIPNSN